MLTVRKLLDSELDWANQCYSEVNFLHSQSKDFIAVAEVNHVKAGLGRLVPIDETTGELGGMYVLPAYRGKKIAGAIVSFLIQQSPYRKLYCIPFAHLEGFYCGFGFQPAFIGPEVPGAVSEKFNWCVKEYPTAVALLLRER